ncbi:SAM-dependent methyltransferase [Kitasatospora sp. MAA19]|uniref:class I SAM-dependent methyltransferase n=1 Tax=Kitasatospora sp. MAA19 TaxID=3035090 RepID=UPI0024760684|nr:class I SAM-dependent methyltransferase [Kitasatospora sp. MAA19]MDH6705829.1 SAM-dependent methyltransferase [Kitasatospora sp. MAA19]
MTDTAADPAVEATPGQAGGFGTALNTAYSEALAGVYDEVYPSTPDLDDIGTFLLTLARPGASVLELGVGTGRVALRLADQGFDVHGVETSPAMLARLAEKDPEGRVTPYLGDLVGLDLGRTFDVVLAPFNVLCCATAVDEQIALMHALARHTAPGGHVVTETFDPSDHHVQRGNAVTTYPVGERSAMIESISVLPASQNMLVQNTLFLDGAAPNCATTVLRYLWPSELDLLGGIARLELTARHSGWREQPFDGGDGRKMCVSVFRPLT